MVVTTVNTICSKTWLEQMDTSLLRFFITPAFVIDQSGEILSASKGARDVLAMDPGHCFFDACGGENDFRDFISGLTQMPFTDAEQCKTAIALNGKELEAFITVIKDDPPLFLLELDTSNGNVAPKIFDFQLANHSDNLLSLVNRNYQYISVNDKYSDVWGKPKKEIEGRHVSEILGEEAFSKIVKKELDECFKGSIRSYTDWFYSESLKQMLFLRVAYRPVINRDTEKVNSVVVTVTDITDVKNNERVTLNSAYRDSLTGLANRNALANHFTKIQWGQTGYYQYALVFLDLDRFKVINDENGHLVGDELLKLFAFDLKRCLEQEDFCCRWGGDEFILLLPVTNNEGERLLSEEEIGDRFAKLQGHSYRVNNKCYGMTFSYGIAQYPNDGSSLEELIKSADRRMYMNKKGVNSKA